MRGEVTVSKLSWLEVQGAAYVFGRPPAEPAGLAVTSEEIALRYYSTYHTPTY